MLNFIFIALSSGVSEPSSKVSEKTTEPLQASSTETLSSNRHKSGPSVMLLTNMIMANELDDEVQEEVADECKKYGRVLEVRPIISSSQSPKRGVPISSKASPSPDDFVHFYVIFEDQNSAISAIDIFNGRFFGGRRIHATLVDREEFNTSVYKQ